MRTTRSHADKSPSEITASAANPPEVQGEALDELDTFWPELAREMTKESIKALEEAAKQMITIASLSQTVYFAAISFSDLKKALGQIAPGAQFGLVALLALPLLFWVVSLACAIRVFTPETYQTNLQSAEATRGTFLRIVAAKQRHLAHAHHALVLGFVPLVVNIVAYLLLAPTAPR